MESSCRDVPAPGVGAECGACPVGFTGDGIKCLGMNCVNSHESCVAQYRDYRY